MAVNGKENDRQKQIEHLADHRRSPVWRVKLGGKAETG